jgi:DNA ligase-1
MKQFTRLFREIDQTTKTNAKVDALKIFFDEAEDQDKLWAIALFSHKRPRRTVNTTLLREWAAETIGLPVWLFEESYHIVGDLAETIALLLPAPENYEDLPLHQYISEIKELVKKEESDKKAYVLRAWSKMGQDERFLFNKLITGGFRIGVSSRLLTKGLSKSTGIDEQVLAHRLMGNWEPDKITFDSLIHEENLEDLLSRPYPFYLTYGLENEPEELGAIDDWYAEWKWDGIRGQLINREGNIYVWSRGEELVTDKFPEFYKVLESEENSYVLDGEIICYKNGSVIPFNNLQTRIGRKNLSKKLLSENPVVMIAYDLLEYAGEDIRVLPIASRRTLLESLCQSLEKTGVILISELIEMKDWSLLKEKREVSRELGAEGLMLKKKVSTYQTGRKKGDWWKWKVDPMMVDAVMIYAQRGHGRRANLYTDFTFAVYDEEGKLVPFTKAYSGLTDSEFNEISRWVRKNTIERFGPVCMVKPELVFELAFEGIAESKRHKSGIALRFPRMKRWRKDKPISEINTLEDLKALM